ncbi:hypothetical protein [Streptomyces prasinosporus]|uniref:hypothetical protein n=1 Tax=Streptomyces prasinosporus TaxID=68256 RepID=UPI0031EE9D08
MFRWTLDAWDAARALGMKAQINTTVTRHDLHDLPDIVRLVAEHGAMLWSAFFLVPTGRGRSLGALTAGEADGSPRSPTTRPRHWSSARYRAGCWPPAGPARSTTTG